MNTLELVSPAKHFPNLEKTIIYEELFYVFPGNYGSYFKFAEELMQRRKAKQIVLLNAKQSIYIYIYNNAKFMLKFSFQNNKIIKRIIKKAKYISLSRTYQYCVVFGGNQCRVISEVNISYPSCCKFSRLYEFGFGLQLYRCLQNIYGKTQGKTKCK